MTPHPEVPERCEGRYPVPATSPPRDEPFDVTYRCGLAKGHVGPHGSGAGQADKVQPITDGPNNRLTPIPTDAPDFRDIEDRLRVHSLTRGTLAADAIASLRQRAEQAEQERDEARAIVANVNNSVFGSQGYFVKPDCVMAIEELKMASNQLRQRAQQAERERGIATGHVCVMCQLPIFGTLIGAGDGTGQQFAHPDCYYRHQLRLVEQEKSDAEARVTALEDELRRIIVLLPEPIRDENTRHLSRAHGADREQE